MIKKIIYSIHRILGTLLSILFLMWFVTGMVLMYHTFPKVNNKQKTKVLDTLSVAHLPDFNSVLHQIPDSMLEGTIRLDQFLGETKFHVQAGKTECIIPADSLKTFSEVNWNYIKQTAEKWCSAQVIRVDTLRKLDQWIPFGQLKKDFPIYKFYYDDEENHQLYISSKSADVLQFTTSDQRFWAWVGAIPHWVYFTILRQDKDLWVKSVVILSALGILMTVSGIWVGIDAYLQRYRRQKTLASPYKKKWYWWHHVTGVLFGVFVLTWIFSGMMSLVDTPSWLGRTRKESSVDRVLSHRNVSSLNYKLDYRTVVKAYSGKIKSVEWDNFRNIPLYNIVTETDKVTIDASADTLRVLQLTEQDVLSVIHEIHGNHIPKNISLLTEYDAYYISKAGHLPLPVYRVNIDNEDKDTYYINPATGKYRHVNNHDRWGFWMYQGLHSLKIKFLLDYPWVWTLVMWTLLTGGAVVSLSGVVLGYRYVARKCRKLKS